MKLVSGPTLREGLRGHDNAFGVIRLVLATAVIFSHAFYLGGWTEDPTHRWTSGRETIGGLAVVGFFIISGYLIAKSGMTTDVLQFLWRRALRIFPAFWAALALAAFVVAPISWLYLRRDLADFSMTEAGGPLDYVVSNALLTVNQWGVYDIFAADTPWGVITGSSVFNGSLWTLVYEWRVYMIIAVLVALGAMKRAPWIVVAVAAFVWVTAVIQHYNEPVLIAAWSGFVDKYLVTLTLAFMIGATAAVLADKVRLDWKFAVLGACIALVSLVFGGWVIVGYVGFGYLLFFIAASLPSWWKQIGQRNDYSYGMYVYGFLVQQLTASWGWHLWGYIPWVLTTVVFTAALAYFSWHGIEKRALALKNWGPGKGLRPVLAAFRSNSKSAPASGQ